MSGNRGPVLKTEDGEEAVEPEIVSGPSRGVYGAHKTPGAMKRFRSFVFKLKLLFAAAIGLIALLLIITGSVLASTLIGAVLGIPLMLAGALLFWVLFKVLTLGRIKSSFPAGRW